MTQLENEMTENSKHSTIIYYFKKEERVDLDLFLSLFCEKFIEDKIIQSSLADSEKTAILNDLYESRAFDINSSSFNRSGTGLYSHNLEKIEKIIDRDEEERLTWLPLNVYNESMYAMLREAIQSLHRNDVSCSYIECPKKLFPHKMFSGIPVEIGYKLRGFSPEQFGRYSEVQITKVPRAGWERVFPDVVFPTDEEVEKWRAELRENKRMIREKAQKIKELRLTPFWKKT